jgi:hypothetical protein
MFAVAPLVLIAAVVVAPPASKPFDLREPIRLRPLPFGLAMGDPASVLPGRDRRPLRRPAPPAPDTVVFHLGNGTYHARNCEHARHCEAECQTISLGEAKLRGTACRACRGSSR